MKFGLIVFLMILAAVSAGPFRSYVSKASYKVGGFKEFRSASPKSSRQIYDLIENNPNDVYVFAFYIQGVKHEDVIADLEKSLVTRKNIFDQVVYAPIYAKDEYQYRGILYDLDIFEEPWAKYSKESLLKMVYEKVL